MVLSLTISEQTLMNGSAKYSRSKQQGHVAVALILHKKRRINTTPIFASYNKIIVQCIADLDDNNAILDFNSMCNNCMWDTIYIGSGKAREMDGLHLTRDDLYTEIGYEINDPSLHLHQYCQLDETTYPSCYSSRTYNFPTIPEQFAKNEVTNFVNTNTTANNDAARAVPVSDM